MPKHQRYSLDGAHIELKRLKLSFGLTLTRVIADADAVEANISPFQLNVVKPMRVRVEIEQPDLQDFLVEKAPSNISDVWVQVQKDTIWVQAQVKMLISISVRAACDLVIKDGKTIEVALKSIEGPANMAKGMVESELKKLNPIFELSKLQVDGEITSVFIDEGMVVVMAAVLPPKAE